MADIPSPETNTTLLSGKILDWSKLKVFADMLKGTQIVKYVIVRLENIGNKHFLLFLKCFQKTSNQGSLKLGM